MSEYPKRPFFSYPFSITFLVTLFTSFYGHPATQIVEAITLTLNQNYQAKHRLTGQIIEKNNAHLSFELSGVVTNLLIDQGEQALKGQVLAIIDNRHLHIEQKRLNANKQRLLAQLKLAQIQQQRLKKLDKSQYSAQQQLDEINTEILVLESSIAEVEYQAENIALQLEKSKLTAPFAGEIAERFVSLGETVNPGQGVYRLVEQHAFQARFFVPAALLTNIYPEMEISSGENTFKAQLLQIGRILDPISKTAQVRFKLPRTHQLLSGQAVRLNISQTVNQPGFWIPLSALLSESRGNWSVYAINGDSSLTSIHSYPVTVLYTEGERAFIQTALKEGQQIVKSGLHKLSNDIQVKLIAIE